jgi:hypothetical protein
MENTFKHILYPFLFEPNLHEVVWAGETLKEVVSKHPEEILGREVCRRYGGELPQRPQTT